jgi:hypothetical protein
MSKRRKKKEYTECIVFWRIMSSLALAESIHRAPFHFNPHRLPYTSYRCPRDWSLAGTREPCEHRSKARFNA